MTKINLGYADKYIIKLKVTDNRGSSRIKTGDIMFLVDDAPAIVGNWKLDNDISLAKPYDTITEASMNLGKIASESGMPLGIEYTLEIV